MISQEYLDKFSTILTNLNIDTGTVQMLARGICTADIIFGDNPEKLSIKRLEVSGVEQFNGVSKASLQSTKPLPDVQVLRIMCDVLFCYLCASNKLSRYASKVYPTNQATFKVINNLNVLNEQAKKKYSVSVGYATLDECQNMLNYLYDSLQEEEISDLPIFDFTSKCIKRYYDIAKAGSRIVNKDMFKYVFLPDKYESFGFAVNTVMPKQLVGIVSKTRAEQIEIWNLAYMMDAFIAVISGTKTTTVYRSAFINRMLRINSGMQDIVPIGIGMSTGTRARVSRPDGLLKNTTSVNLFNSIFSDNIPLSKTSVENTLEIYSRLVYKTRN